MILDLRFKIISFLSFALVLSFHSCTRQSQISNPPPVPASQSGGRAGKFQITDDAGIEVTFDSLPKRIISLAPNITEALFEITADSLVVGVTDLCDYPAAAKTKTKTGSYLSPDYEVMTLLNPDLIIMNVENISNPT
ncbi:MAG: helical backbone metal receptor, partial [bacterium]